MEEREFEKYLEGLNIHSIEKKMVDVFADRIRNFKNNEELEDEFLIFMLEYPEFAKKMRRDLIDSFIMKVRKKLHKDFDWNFNNVYEIGEELLESDFSLNTFNNMKELDFLNRKELGEFNYSNKNFMVINEINNKLHDLARKLRNMCNNYPNKIVAIFAFVFLYNIVFDPNGVPLDELLKEAGLPKELLNVLKRAIRINTILHSRKPRGTTADDAGRVLGAHIDNNDVVCDSENERPVVIGTGKVVIDKSLLEDLLDRVIRINSESADLARKINDAINGR